jgi:hypothetical protein
LRERVCFFVRVGELIAVADAVAVSLCDIVSVRLRERERVHERVHERDAVCERD